MTLADLDPHPSSLILPSSSARVEDRRWLRHAAAAAFLMHFGLVLIPLPSSTPPVPPARPGSTLVIWETRFDPPEIERPPQAPRQPTVREQPRPVPFAPEEMAEPVPEPADASTEPDAPFDPTFILDPVPVAPPASGPLDETTLGLLLPVALPDRVRPEYPRMGRIARLEGTVVLKAVVDEEGRVGSIRVVSRPVPDPGFSESAVAAVSQWRYKPGEYGGEPVAVQITVVVDFVLE